MFSRNRAITHPTDLDPEGSPNLDRDRIVAAVVKAIEPIVRSIVAEMLGSQPEKHPTHAGREAVSLTTEARSEIRKLILETLRETGPAGKSMVKEKPLRKKLDLSAYLTGTRLTERQHECLSLRLEYGLSVNAIARRLGIHRKTVQEHLDRGQENVNHSRNRDRARAAKAKTSPDER